MAMATDIYGILLPMLICLCFRAQMSTQQADGCVTTNSSLWISRVSVVDDLGNQPGPTSGTVRWEVDQIQTSTPRRYIVRFKPINTITSTPTNETQVEEYTLRGLFPNMEYNISVCRVVQDSSRPDNCGSCSVILQTTHAQEPPSEPVDVTVTPGVAEQLLVAWSQPIVVNGGIRNYSIECTPGGSQQPLPQMVIDGDTRLLASFEQLSPGTNYSCSVVAVNDFGSSPSVTVEGSTLPRTTVPGALLVYYGNTISYHHVADGQVSETSELLITTTDEIKGMDYNFESSTLYLTTNASGTVALKELEMNTTSDEAGRITLQPINGSFTTIQTAPVGVEYGHIAVDWISNDIFFVETQSNRIMRLIAPVGGPIQGPYCVAQLSDSITNIAVDPVHGFFYWSNSTNLVRMTLGAVQTTSETCQSPSPQVLASLPTLVTFTIEQDESIYFLGQYRCTDQSTEEIRAILSTNLAGSATSIYNFKASSATLLESFTKTHIYAVNNFILSVSTNGTFPVCPGTVEGVVGRTLPDTIKLIRMYRSAKQPLPVPPGPPISIKITTTNIDATITWKRPQFVGTFFSTDAFDDWTYIINYCPLDAPSSCTQISTMSLQITLGDLTNSTNYRVTLSASSPGGGSVRHAPEIVFRTKADDFDLALLLLARESGVQRSSLGGADIDNIGERFSDESSAVAYDGHTNSIFWSIEGGQASMYVNRGGDPDMVETLYQRRDQPFALEYDWVGNRLLWVEDGDNTGDPRREIIASLDPKMDPMVLNDVGGVQSTAVDAYNGVLFWTDLTNIRMQTLSGLDLDVCLSPASSLAVDARRRRLYWLSSGARPGDALTISQMEYNSTNCDTSSIQAQELTQISFSSGSTILAYGSDTLFISSRASDSVYTISSDLGSVGARQTMATGSVQFTGSAPSDIRDIVVASRDLQPFPGTIELGNRGLEFLRPSPPSPFTSALGRGSTASNIVIEWQPSSRLPEVPSAPLFYVVDYTLNRGAGIVVTSSVMTLLTSVSLEDQVANTEVSVRVTTYSPWAKSLTSINGSFTTPPDRPNQVTNIRVFTFGPNTNTMVITGLVTWDEMEYVDNYLVRVLEGGAALPNLYTTPFPDTSYVILFRDEDNMGRTSYLQADRAYQVEVTASNEAGTSMPSTLANFTTNGANEYPEQVLTVGVGESGSQFLGSSLDINQNLPISEAGPVVVDTIGRTAYWHSPSENRIYNSSLLTGTQMPFLPVPEDREILSLAFDWIGQYIYMLRMETNTRRLELYRVLIHDTDRLLNVFEDLEDTVQENDTYQLIMNPFTGFVYWIQAAPATGQSSLHQLDLRVRNATSSTLLTQSPAVGRRRRGRSLHMRQKRQVLSSLSLTSALAQDPVTGELLVCDEASGDIYRCNPATMMCSVVVERLQLRLPGGVIVTGDAGLPATSLALNEQRLYWAREDSLGLYAVDLSAMDTLLVVSNIANVFSINTLSPGQQIIPAEMECLSPDFLFAGARPTIVEDLVMVTNTTISVAWDVVAPLPPSCRGVVFSVSPYTYTVDYELSTNQPEFTITTRRTCTTFTDLLPFQLYTIVVSVANQYTSVIFPEQRFHARIEIMTTQGVPLLPTGLVANVTGTASVQLVWDSPSVERLLGDIRLYYIFLENGMEETLYTNLTLTNSPSLTRGTVNVVQLIINNGKFNSSSLSIDVPLWVLVPTPTETDSTNSTFNVSITLLDEERYRNILHVAVLCCNYRLEAMEVPGGCSCLFNSDIMENEDIAAVDGLPFSEVFFIQGLEPHTNYCIQSVGYYGSETTLGIGGVLMTGSGIPDAPNTTRNGSVLSWTEPKNNGEEITSYILSMKQANTDADFSSTSLHQDTRSYDLQQLPPDIIHEVKISAENMIGRGPPGEVIRFLRNSDVEERNLTIIPSKPLSVLLGDYISLNCSSTPPADVDISYTWTHLNTSTVLEETSNILTFPRISVEELGTYRCSASSHFPAEVTITSARPLIETGSYPARITSGSCPSPQLRDDILVDVLQLLSAQFGVHPLGLTMSYAAESCDQVAEANPGSPSGMYWIYSDGNPVQVLCQF